VRVSLAGNELHHDKDELMRQSFKQQANYSLTLITILPKGPLERRS